MERSMPSLSDQRRMTLYLDNDDKAQAKRLLELLAQDNPKLRDHRGMPSMSALFRYLVEEELKRQENPQ